MEFRLLGPVEAVREDRSLPLGGAKPRALLALLLIHANEVVSRDRLDRGALARAPARDGGAQPGRAGLEAAEGVRARRAPGDAERRLRRSRSTRRPSTSAASSACSSRVERANADEQAVRGARCARRGARPLARQRTRGPRIRGVRTRRDRAARRAAARGARGASRRSSWRSAVTAHSIPELETLVRRAPAARAAPRAADARPLPVRATGRRAPRVRRRTQAARRGARHRAWAGAQDAWSRRSSARIRRSISRVRPATARRRRIAASAFALAAAGVAAAAVVVFTQGGTENAQALAEPDSNVLLSADTGDLVREVPVRGTAWVRFDGDSLWSVSDDGVLTRIDPVTGETIATIGLGVEPGRPRGRRGVGLGHRPPLADTVPDRPVGERALEAPSSSRWTELSADGTGEVAVGAWLGLGRARNGQSRVRGWSASTRKQDVSRSASRSSPGTSTTSRSGKAPSGSRARRRASCGRSIRRRTRSVFKRKLQSDLCCVAVGGGFVWAGSNPEGVIWKVTTDGTRPADNPAVCADQAPDVRERRALGGARGGGDGGAHRPDDRRDAPVRDRPLGHGGRRARRARRCRCPARAGRRPADDRERHRRPRGRRRVGRTEGRDALRQRSADRACVDRTDLGCAPAAVPLRDLRAAPQLQGRRRRCGAAARPGGRRGSPEGLGWRSHVHVH